MVIFHRTFGMGDIIDTSSLIFSYSGGCQTSRENALNEKVTKANRIL
jgi:hypothetical protein